MGERVEKSKKLTTVEEIRKERTLENERLISREAISNQKYLLFQTRCLNFFKKAVFVFVFVLLLILALGLVFLPLADFVWKDNTVAPIVTTVVQWIMGLVSLIIGIWGLLLAIKSDRSSNKASQANLGMETSFANKNPEPMLKETDVNPKTL